MAIKADPDIDYAKSTGAYPMDKDPTPLFVDNSDIDYSKSTGAYPMYDEHVVVGENPSGTAQVEHVVEHVGSDQADVQFPTPGPVSSGAEEAVAKQRTDLGLSADPSGDSDAGYEARPSTIAVPGADGVDRDAQTKVVDSPKKAAPRKNTQAQGK